MKKEMKMTDLVKKYMGKKLFCYEPGKTLYHCPHCKTTKNWLYGQKSDNFIKQKTLGFLDVGILNNKNIGGMGIGFGIRGNFWYSEKELEDSITRKNGKYRKGDSMGRCLYTIDEIDELLKDMGHETSLFDDGKEVIFNLIKKNRDSYCSADPDGDRKEGLYVELEEIFN